MIFAVGLTLVLYLLFLCWVALGWELTRGSESFSPSKFNGFSIVVAFRNESKNISQLIQCIQNQEYSNECFELILVDDHSTDNTIETINKMLVHSNISIRVLALKDGYGKKSAMKLGIDSALFPWIVATDADCLMGGEWLKSINHLKELEGAKMIVGPVVMSGNNRFFQILQQMEFTSLIASSAAGIRFGMPNMCNGANLAFERRAFYEVGGYESHQHIASGDDEFLMHEIWSKFPGQVVYNKSKRGIVSTSASEDMRSFFSQRKRWASKWESYKNQNIKYLSVFVFAVQMMWIILLAVSLVYGGFLYFLEGYILKIIADGILLYRMAHWFGFRFHWHAFFALEIFYPFYVVIFALVGRKKGYFWKDRDLGR